MPTMQGFWVSLDDVENTKQFFQAPKNDTNSFIIGREPGADGILVNDEWTDPKGATGSRISRTHCVVTSKVSGEFTVKDISTCGTWVEQSGNRGKYSRLEKNADSTLMHGDFLYLIDPHVAGFCLQHCILKCVYNMNAGAKRRSARLQKPKKRAPKKRAPKNRKV